MKPNYWNGYKRFTLCAWRLVTNHRIDRAIRKAYKYVHHFPTPAKPTAIQGTTSTGRPKRGGGYGII